ncbi:hypothetical protein QBC41DRAFT_357798 [Cercophora samala]|uniref:BZIP domain-containing protein n=1 Tax=Cercophora samala TaxID=330535 RepID=A0AA39Z9K0_9PEZI|nr:hypothetical protein QBC41DRAFT_357798 [Cercophora samala]
MDGPSHYFDQCLDDLEETHTFQTPDHDVNEHTLELNFGPYDDKIAFGPTPSQDDVPPQIDLGGPPYEWEGIHPVDTTMDPHAGHKLFVDPGLYQPDPDNEDIKAGIQVLSMEMSRPSTQRTSSSKSHSNRTSKSGSTSTDITLPEDGLHSHPPNKKRKTRRIKKEANMEQDEHKRNKFLERNRIAASKCREKKKVYVSELEEAKIGLENQHASLQVQFQELLGEVAELKHHLMTHAKCNDSNIDRWLNNEATRFVQVQTNNELFGAGFTFGQPATGASQPPVLTPGSPRSRNASIASTQYQLQGGMTGFEGLTGGPGSTGTGPGSDRQGSIAYPPGESMFWAATPTVGCCGDGGFLLPA